MLWNTAEGAMLRLHVHYCQEHAHVSTPPLLPYLAIRQRAACCAYVTRTPMLSWTLTLPAHRCVCTGAQLAGLLLLQHGAGETTGTDACMHAHAHVLYAYG